MVGTGLVESTTSGELLTNIREAINSVNVPGRDDNRAHEMYSNAVDILKALNPEGKFNYGYSVMSMGCYAEAMKMNVWMRYYATKIRIIDANYYNHEILHKYFGGMSGGGGAASSF